MQYNIHFNKISIQNKKLQLVLEGKFAVPSEITKVKLIMHFENGPADRRLPVVIKERHWDESTNMLTINSEYTYLLDKIFWKFGVPAEAFTMYFNLLYGNDYEEKIPVEIKPDIFEQDSKYYICDIKNNHLYFTIPHNEKNNSERLLKAEGRNPRLKQYCKYFLWLTKEKDKLKILRRRLRRRRYRKLFQQINQTNPLVKNRISFISVRRNDLSGNFAFVYEKIKDQKDLDIQLYLNAKDILDVSKEEINSFSYLCATSKVIVLDEYTPEIYRLDLKDETRVVQLWHACGAYKSFGFSRLGKAAGTPQASRIHRNYDFVTVSGSSVKICYSEGFGIPTSHVVPTGIPRTDIFFDPIYREKTCARLRKQFPQISEKKVILFAPTFRGRVRENAYYPMDKFRVDDFMRAVGEDYFLIIKHHPFVSEKHPFSEAVKDRVLDCSSMEELNDLLFISDLIITDYSSLVFEASLLNIPMLFYAFDLKPYIEERDFYWDFETFVPGNFFYTQKELEEAIIKENFSSEKVEAFAKRFFDDFDGRSSERVAELLYSALLH